MTDNRYAQWENLNGYRNYPFAEHAEMADSDGNALAADVFVDAILNPIVHEEAPVYLSLLSMNEVRAECGEDSYAGTCDGSSSHVELYDKYGRHAGTLVFGPGWKREFSTLRTRRFHAEFSSVVSCPIVYNWVEGFVHDGFRSTRRDVTFEGDDVLTPLLSDESGKWVLSFDAFYDPGVVADEKNAIRQVVFASIGQTVFEVDQATDASVILWTPQLDRDDICWQAHREDPASVVSDTCENPSSTCPTPTVPYTNKRFDVCPTETGEVTLVADDFLDYRNPIKIESKEAGVSPHVPVITRNMTEESVIAEGDALLSRPLQTGNEIEISIPGLKHAI
jgi:hypothetical protein